MGPATLPFRTISVSARDRNGVQIDGASFLFKVDGTVVGEIPRSVGSGSIHLAQSGIVTVAAKYRSEVQIATLGAGQNAWIFTFDVDVGQGFMSLDIPLVAGVLLIAVVLALTFSFSAPNPLQTRLVIAVASLGGGLIATEIPGMLKLDISLGTKVVIAATGALAVFVVLYLLVPG